MCANSKRPNNTPNASIYAPINKCNFIPSCAFEKAVDWEKFGAGQIMRLYITDDARHYRAVYSENGIGKLGMLCNTRGDVIYWQSVASQYDKYVIKMHRFMLKSISKNKRKLGN